MSRTLILVFASLILVGNLQAENWPSWRGPLQNGISTETKLPTSWGPKENITWELPLPGAGGSTPIVWGNRIFLTSAEGQDLVLVCASTEGKELWKRKLGVSNRTKIRNDEGNEASASPSTDGKYVFAFVGSGDFACYDFEGKEIWAFNAQKRYGRFSIQHGMHTTPLLHENHIYLSLLHGNGHWVIAFNKATGEEVWKVERPTDARAESKEAYTSPCLADDGKEKYIVVHGADYTTGHRLSDGKEIWRVGDLNPKNRYSDALRIIASPVVSTNLIVIPTARGGLVVAIKPDVKGKIEPGSSQEQWRKAKGAPDVPSPLILDGLVYLCRENGNLLCLDAKSGDLLSEISLHNDRYRASPVYADGKLYIVSRDGTFSVLKSGPKIELLNTNHLNDNFTASPAISQGRLYLRGFNKLYAVAQETK